MRGMVPTRAPRAPRFGLQAGLALCLTGMLLPPAVARAGSCDAHLFSRRFPPGEVVRVDRPIDIALFIDHNGSGCGRRIHVARAAWTIRRGATGTRRPIALPSRRSGGFVKWRFRPRRPGVYVLTGTPTSQPITLGPRQSRHVILVLASRRRPVVRRRVRFVITTGPGTTRPRRADLQVARVRRPPGFRKAFIEPVARVRFHPGRLTRARRLPPGEYLASAALVTWGLPLTHQFHVRRDGTIRLDFTAIRVSLRLGWTPRDRRLRATLKDAEGVRHEVLVDEAGRAELSRVAPGPATLQIVDGPRRRRRGGQPHPGGAPRRLTSERLVVPRQATFRWRLPAVYLYASTPSSPRTTDWTKWPGVRSAQGNRWVPRRAPRRTRLSALGGAGRSLAAVGRLLWRTDGRTWWSHALPRTLRAGSPAAVTVLGPRTFAWVDRGDRYFPYVSYLTRHGVSQEVLTPGRWCELTGITHTAARHLVVVGRCRRSPSRAPSTGFIAVRDTTAWRIVKGRFRPLRAIAAARRGFYLADDRGILHLPRGLSSRPVRLRLPWTATQAPVTVRQLLWRPDGLVALFGSDTTGYCPLHHRSRIARLRRGRFTVLHDGRATTCGRCYVDGGHCTPRSGVVVRALAWLNTHLWALRQRPAATLGPLLKLP